MGRYGIGTKNMFGVPIPALRKKTKKPGINHELAPELWQTVVHEARKPAGFIREPSRLTHKKMESYAKNFDLWDICIRFAVTFLTKLRLFMKNRLNGQVTIKSLSNVQDLFY